MLSFKGVEDGTRRCGLLPGVRIISTSVFLRIGKIKLTSVGTRGADVFFLPQHEEQRIEESLCI